MLVGVWKEREPGFRSRLIASVQFALGKATVPDGGARLIVERMVEETESFARPLKLAEVVNTRPLRRTLLVLQQPGQRHANMNLLLCGISAVSDAIWFQRAFC